VETIEGADIYKPRGVFRKRGVTPVTGDMCEVSRGTGGDAGVIESICARKNELIRPCVSNIDGIAVVFAADTLNTALLDKYLIILESQKTSGYFEVFIIINKTDLANGGSLDKICSIYENAGYPVILTCCPNKSGFERLSAELRGKVTALAGPSGVGKSSITNILCGESVMKVGELSKKIQRGKHTTRHSEMFSLGCGGYIIDTPGFASLDFTGITCADLKTYFKEFARHEENCRFADCAHIGEPDCAVREQAGEQSDFGVSAARYKNYIVFYNELKERDNVG